MYEDTIWTYNCVWNCFVFVEMSFVCRVSLFFYYSLDLRWSLKWLNLDIASVTSVLIQLFSLAKQTRRKKRYERTKQWLIFRCVALRKFNSMYSCTDGAIVIDAHGFVWIVLLLAVLLVRPFACMCVPVCACACKMCVNILVCVHLSDLDLES